MRRESLNIIWALAVTTIIVVGFAMVSRAMIARAASNANTASDVSHH